MEGNVYQLGVVVSLSDLASNKILSMHDNWKELRKGMDDASDAAKRFDRGMSLVKTGLASLAASAGIYSIASSLSDSAKEAGKLESNIRSLGVSKSEVAAISKEVGFMASQMGISKETFLTGVYDIKSGISSLDGATLPKFAESIAITASATKGNFAEMSKLFAMTYNQYKSSYNGMNDLDFGNMVGNTLSIAVKKYRTDGAAMNQAMNSLGSAAQSIGYTLTEQTAVLGTLQNVMNPGEAGTAYRAFLSKIGSGLAELGIKAEDSKGKLKSMPVILGEIKNKFGENIDTSKEMPALIKAFGEEGVKAITNLLPHTSALEKDIKELNLTVDNMDFSAMKEMANQNLSSYSSQLDRLDEGWKALKISLGSALAEGIFASAISWLADLVGWTLKWVESSPLVKEFFGYFLFGASVIAGFIGFMVSLTGATMMYTAVTTSTTASILLKTGMLFYNTGAMVVNTAQQWISISANKAAIIARQTNIAVMGLERTSMTLSTALYAVATAKLGLVTAAQWAWNAAISANPLGLIVAGVMALIGVVILAVKYFDVWSSWISDLGSSVMNLYRENQMLVSGLLFLMGPVGWLIQGALVLADNWDKVTQSVRTAYDWIRKMTGTSEATVEMENSLRGLNSAIDDLNAKREKAAKFGLTDDVKKYDSQIVSLEKQKSLMDSGLKQETEYRKSLKESSDLKNSLKSEMEKGSFGKKGSAEYKSAEDQLRKLEEKSSLSKDKFLESGISKQTEDTKKLASATEDLNKKQSARKASALDLMNANYGAVFNGGLPNTSGKMPDLPVVNAKLNENVSKPLSNQLESGVKSAVQTMPVSLADLTAKLESILSTSGKRLGSAFSLEFKRGIEMFSFKDLELHFQKGFGILFGKLSAQAFNGGRNLVLTYNSGVGKETGGSNQVSALTTFTGVIKDFFNWSDAKRGPLSRTTEAGSNLIKTYSVGIVKAKDYLDKPLSDALEQKPMKAAKNLAENIAGESYSPKGNISTNAKNTNLNIQGINISLKDGLEGIGKILEDLIIARAEALDGV